MSTRRRLTAWTGWAGACLPFLGLGLLGTAGGVKAQTAGVPEAVERLEHLVGSWETDRVEFLGPDGEVARTAGATAHNELQLGGQVLVHRGRLDDPVIETRGWYYLDGSDGRLHMGSVTSSGRYDEFVGGWEGDRLVMTTLPSPALGDRIFRMTHSEISRDGYVETMEVSEDGGETWRRSHRQRMRRVAAGSTADAGEVLAALDAYTGHWKTEEKTGPRGRGFHFEYDLGWMDPGRTIARIVIERVEADGSVSTVFEGYKGREPASGGVYYFGASPSGRGSRGEVVMEGADLVTVYEGWTAAGDVVRIRDVFRPVADDGSFVSRTFMKASAEADWRQIGEDHWTRVGPPR